MLLVLAVIALRYLKYWRRLRDGIAHRSPPAYSVLLLIVVIPATKMLDSIVPRVHILKLVEESLELTLPVITLVAVAQYLLARRTAAADCPKRQEDERSGPSRLHLRNPRFGDRTR